MTEEYFPSSQTENKSTPKRCINIDWLEIHAREPINEPRDAEYFRKAGMFVREREYGTRVYRQMFVIEGTDGQPLIEVRRDPASKGINGIHDANECHLRLVNRACYFDNAATLFKTFLIGNGYTDIRISRIDLCLDFEKFDKGDNPQAFIRRYFRHKYAKINQGNIHGHGSDNWSGQEWNSIAWGAKSSPVSTKLYNKTMELYDAKTDTFAKPWIRHAWLLCGLVDDMQRCTKDGQLVNVWRVEFSIKSAVKNWVAIALNGNENELQSLHNTLDVYANRGQMLVMFASLAQHYFRFKKFKQGKRKDRCKDKVLFEFSGMQVTYKVGRPDYAAGNEYSMRERYARLIAKIKMYQQSSSVLEVHKACDVLIQAMTEDELRAELASPWSREELETMRAIIRLRSKNPELSYETAMSEVKKLLDITDRTIDYF